MLVLTRKLGQKIKIGDDVEVTILSIRGKDVRLGVDAPRDVKILRDERNKANKRGRHDAAA